MASKTRLRSRQQRGNAGTCGGITAKGELLGDEVTIGLETEEGQEERQVVADIVDVLLSVDKFVEGDLWVMSLAMSRTADGLSIRSFREACVSCLVRHSLLG